MKWPEMRSKVNFGHPKWPKAVICPKFPKQIKLRIDLKWPVMRVIWTMFEPTAGWLQLGINIYIYIYTHRQLCWERGNIHCVRPLGLMHTILVIWCSCGINLMHICANYPLVTCQTLKHIHCHFQLILPFTVSQFLNIHRWHMIILDSLCNELGCVRGQYHTTMNKHNPLEV